MKMPFLKNSNSYILFTGLFAALFTASAIWFLNYLNQNNTFNSEAAAINGRRLPEVSLTEFKSGANFSEKVKQGNVFLVYLISGCDACEKQLRIISDLGSQSGAHNQVFGVMFEDRETVSNYIKKHNISFPILLDEDRKLLNDLNLKYFPANLALENGVIKKTSFGASPDGKSL